MLILVQFSSNLILFKAILSTKNPTSTHACNDSVVNWFSCKVCKHEVQTNSAQKTLESVSWCKQRLSFQGEFELTIQHDILYKYVLTCSCLAKMYSRWKWCCTEYDAENDIHNLHIIHLHYVLVHHVALFLSNIQILKVGSWKYSVIICCSVWLCVNCVISK